MWNVAGKWMEMNENRRSKMGENKTDDEAAQTYTQWVKLHK